ncbi:MAG: restriction endonuclease [Pseudanabaenaceae cyanobacterium]|jgi:restriction system protein
MLYRKTKLLLGVILVFSSSLIPQVSIAKLNISPEPERIELNDRLDRCKEKGFVVNQSLNTEKALRKLVADCEAKLFIGYPIRSQLLEQVEGCLQKGYKAKIPRSLTLVKLNDLAYDCKNYLEMQSNDLARKSSGIDILLVLIGFIVIAVFIVILIGTVSTQNSFRGDLTHEEHSNQLLEEQWNRANQLLYEVDMMTGKQFEEFLAEVYQSFGWVVKLRGGSNDGGCDLVISREDGLSSVAIQAKRYKNNVGYDAVQQVYAGRGLYNTQHAWVVTNSYFTKSAQSRAKELNVTLCDRDYLAQLIFDYIPFLDLQ